MLSDVIATAPPTPIQPTGATRLPAGQLPTGDLAWPPLAAEVGAIGAAGLTERTTRLETWLRGNGATLARQPVSPGDEPGSADASRPWQLATLPTVITAADWRPLAAGMAQRTRVLETVLADLLGDQRLIAEGIVPPGLLWANPRFYRPYHRLGGVAEHRLHVTAGDVARGPDGTWTVLGDRTRAPSGLGYLLENRLAIRRVYQTLLRDESICRLAPFFAGLRRHFDSLAPRHRDNPRVALLTPPGASYRSFEDAYLARYLGYTLVQGSDLTVRDGRLHLKTLGGLLPIEVLWRHVSDRRCDPLELDGMSYEGTAGLVQTVRSRQLALVNGLGSVLAQMPGLMPYLPAAARLLCGEELLLPQATTLWLGEPHARSRVLPQFDRWHYRDALAVTGAGPLMPEQLDAASRAELLAAVTARPEKYVAIEPFEPSRTTVWRDGQIRQWSVAYRVFALTRSASEGGRVELLPGALAGLSPDARSLAGSPTDGHLTADTWVQSEGKTDTQTTLLPDASASVELRRGGSELPSRVADSLFWLGRNLERCEGIVRLMRATLVRLAGEDGAGGPQMPRLIAALAAIGQIEPDHAIEELTAGIPKADDVLPASVFPPLVLAGGRTTSTSALQDAINVGLRNAIAVRDRLSLDANRIFRQLHRCLTEPAVAHDASAAMDRLSDALTYILAFSGIVAESMVRTHGWRFLQLGRRIERASMTTELLLSTLTHPLWDETQLCEAILDATDSLMTYRSRYRSVVKARPTIDLMVTDETNPRSLRFQMDSIAELLHQLPTEPNRVSLGKDERLASELAHRLRVADIDRLAGASGTSPSKRHRIRLTELLELIATELPKLSGEINRRYLIHTADARTLRGRW